MEINRLDSTLQQSEEKLQGEIERLNYEAKTEASQATAKVCSCSHSSQFKKLT